MQYKELYRREKTGIVTKCEPRIKLVCEFISDSGARILDVGCNDGFVSQFLKKNGNTVIGMEINPELGNSARQHIDEVIVQDVEEPWQAEDNSFDVVHMGYILEHVLDYDFLLKEAHRVLKDGGVLIISVPNFAYVRHRLELLLGRLPRWYTNKKHVRAWTKSWLTRILHRHGFRPIKWAGTLARDVAVLTPISRFLPSLSSILICKAVKVKK